MKVNPKQSDAKNRWKEEENLIVVDAATFNKRQMSIFGAKLNIFNGLIFFEFYLL